MSALPAVGQLITMNQVATKFGKTDKAQVSLSKDLNVIATSSGGPGAATTTTICSLSATFGGRTPIFFTAPTYNAPTNGTATTSGTFRVFTFTNVSSAGSLAITNTGGTATIYYLLVGGGGGGGM